jgi:hypothetical protein
MKEIHTTKNILSWGLVISWLLIMAFAFWWFELRWYQQVDFQYSDALFDSSQMLDEQIAGNSDQSAAIVVHYYDPKCPCTRFNNEHVLELITTYQAKGVHFMVKVPDEAAKRSAQGVFGDVEVQVISASSAPSASPAALVVDAQGLPVYVGPYSPGAVCTSKSGDFVGLALDDMLSGKDFKQTVNLANGCFCQWPA